MNAEQKQRAADLLSAWRATAYALHADRMADLLQELVDAPEPDPVAKTTGYYGGHLTISTVDGRVLPFGTALYLAQPAPSVPDGWMRAIDEALVVHHIDIADSSDGYEEAKKKLNELLAINSDIARDCSEPPADLVRDAEPVAYVTGVYGGHTTVAPIDAAQVLRVGVALYTAPPAPSVPLVRSTGQWESSRIADYNRGWNACREAMLAAPQQEPLSDERILSIGKRFLDRGYYPFEGLQPWVYSFARAIEREILGGDEK